MTSPLAQVVALASARVTRTARSGEFDVSFCAGPAVTGLLDRWATLAGQSQVLSPDPWRFLWTPSRRAYVPFHVGRFSLIAWRDPVGAPEDRADALRLFRAYAARLGRHALVLAASAPLAQTAVDEGFRSLWVGSEQRFDLDAFTMRGRAAAKLRLAINHARRAGAHAREAFPRSCPEDRAEIDRVELAWKAQRPARRTDSFLRTAPMETAERRRYFVVDAPSSSGVGDDSVQAIAVCSQVSARGWYLQDLVRHPSAPRGVSELVAVEAVEAFRREQFAFATMGIVPFFDPRGDSDKMALPRAAAWCIRHFDRAFRFSGLQQFRAKFHAHHIEPVYALYWPRVMTPLVAWDVARLLAPRASA